MTIDGVTVILAQPRAADSDEKEDTESMSILTDKLDKIIKLNEQLLMANDKLNKSLIDEQSKSGKGSA